MLTATTLQMSNEWIQFSNRFECATQFELPVVFRFELEISSSMTTFAG